MKLSSIRHVINLDTGLLNSIWNTQMAKLITIVKGLRARALHAADQRRFGLWHGERAARRLSR